MVMTKCMCFWPSFASCFVNVGFFAPARAVACSSAPGHLVPMKEHLEPHRTHTAGPRGGSGKPPSDSYFRILDPVSAVGK